MLISRNPTQFINIILSISFPILMGLWFSHLKYIQLFCSTVNTQAKRVGLTFSSCCFTLKGQLSASYEPVGEAEGGQTSIYVLLVTSGSDCCHLVEKIVPDYVLTDLKVTRKQRLEWVHAQNQTERSFPWSSKYKAGLSFGMALIETVNKDTRRAIKERGMGDSSPSVSYPHSRTHAEKGDAFSSQFSKSSPKNTTAPLTLPG